MGAKINFSSLDNIWGINCPLSPTPLKAVHDVTNDNFTYYTYLGAAAHIKWNQPTIPVYKYNTID